jgi:hydrogenase-4 component B
VIALMASVMIKTAVYGLCRFYFDFLGNSFLWWGFFLVASGIISALYGILLAVLQNNIKRFLAYSSAENMGIILISMGLALIFKHFDQTALAALAFFTVLFHSFNHALFKGLLFICGGVIFTQLKSLELSKLRGLNKKMPYTAICFLAGVMSLASLPPFAGFVSEWLLLQNLFQLLFYLTNPVLRLLVIITLALVLLVGGLAVIGAIKNFGVAFLGKTVLFMAAVRPSIGMTIRSVSRYRQMPKATRKILMASITSLPG